MSTQISNRLQEIDGIRGWAALMVLLFHVIAETFGTIQPAFRSDFTYFIFNGGLAVAIFFVLSGDALSASYLRHRDPTCLDALLIKRYFRLTAPIFLSCLLVYFLMKAGATYNIEASKIVHREEWLGTFIAFEPNLVALLRYSFYQVYDGHKLAISYNPFLWTMSVELVGSMLVFLYLYVSSRIKTPIKILSLLIIFLFILRSYYSLFFVGVLFGKLREANILTRLRSSKPWQIASAFIVISIVIVDTLIRDIGAIQLHANIIFASILVFCLYSSNWSISFFSSKISRMLGRISFPLYLVHFCIIVSITSFLITKFSSNGILDNNQIWLIIFISIAASISGAFAFLFIENRIIFYINKIPKMLIGAREPPFKQA